MTAAAALAGCSLIVPLDYTGGTPPSHGHGGQSGTGPFETGGSAGDGLGGTLGDAGMSEGGQGNATAEGGAEEGGSSGGTEPSTGGDTSAGKGGTTGGTGAMGGTAGTGGSGAAGGTAGTGGGEATGGMNTGGLGGTTTAGGMGGQGGTPAGGLGGMGGMSGTSTAGNANCPDADLSSDPANCGSCGNVCGSNQDCADGRCISSPCDGICATWLMPDDYSGGPKRNSVGTTADVCVEVASYDPSPGFLPAFNCWNTSPPRVMQVNGVTMTCNSANHPLNVPKRKGGYCVHATAGDYAWAGFVMPYTASDCCTAPPAGTAGAGH